MADDFDLSDLYSTTREDEERRRKEAARAKQEAEEARQLALEERRQAEQQARKAELARLGAMNPIRRWINTHRTATIVFGTCALAILGIVAYFAVQNQRVEALLASCDASRFAEIPESQRERFIASWAQCPGEDIRAWAAANAGPSQASILETMAGDESVAVRKAVAANSSTPASSLAAMTSDSDVEVRLVLANRQVAVDTLALDLAPEVREVVTTSPLLSEESLVQLAEDDYSDVKLALIQREVRCLEQRDCLNLLPESALLALARDQDPQVCQAIPLAILSRAAVSAKAGEPWGSKMMVAASRCDSETTRAFVAQEASGKATDLLDRLGRDPSPQVRAMVALNVNTDPQVLASLATDKSADVRIAVAQALNVTPEILALLQQDSDREVRRAAEQTLKGRSGGDS